MLDESARARHGRACRLLSLAMVIVTVVMAGAVTPDAAYRASVDKWRVEREASLKADEGWLTVAALFWLHEGVNRVGSDPLNDFVLPESAPPSVGLFEFHTGRTTFRAAEGVPVTLGGRPVQTVDLRPGADDTLVLGDLSMFVHKSGERFAIRLRDRNSRIRRAFTGLRWFPIDEQYRIDARFRPYAQPKTVQVPNILGDQETYTASGIVEFALDGLTLTLEVFESRPDRLFIVFRDLTSGKESYPAARFLYADAPKDGTVILDFNRAYNPPCAYNPYTTCPLPPEQNRLRVRIAAGELNYHTPTVDD